MYIYETYIYEAFYDLRCISDEVNNSARKTEREIAIQAFEDCVKLGDEDTDAMTSFLESLGNLDDVDYKESLDTLRDESDFFNKVYEKVSMQSKVLEEKRELVDNELKHLVVKIDPEVEYLHYIPKNENEDEIVEIIYKNGYTRKAVVTADSKVALCRDVLKEIR